MANQLTFDLALPPPTYAREDFVTASGNREALAWIDRWPDWPAPALALSGPPGCGKTHLGRIWAARAGAISIDGAALEGKSVADLTALAAASPAIVIEHAERAPERGAVPPLQSDARAARPSAADRGRAAGALVDRLARSRLAAARGARGDGGAARRRVAGLDHPETARRSAIACRRRGRALSGVAHGALGRMRRGGSSRRSIGGRWPSGARSTAAWRPMSWPSWPARLPDRGGKR